RALETRGMLEVALEVGSQAAHDRGGALGADRDAQLGVLEGRVQRTPHDPAGPAERRGRDPRAAGLATQPLERLLEHEVGEPAADERLWLGLEALRFQQPLHEPG